MEDVEAAESVRVVPTACQGCLSNCSVLVTLEEARPGLGSLAGGPSPSAALPEAACRVVRVGGNPACEATGGAVCPNLDMALEQREDPDRLLYPMRRANPRKGRFENPRFERVSWDEALGLIADRLVSLRERGEGHRVAFAKGRSTGIGELFFKVLPDIYGTPNRLNHDGICAEAEKLSTGCLDGVWDYHDYDLDNVECVFMWGADPLVGNRMKPRFMRAARDLRKRAHLVTVDPHRSVTAAASHEWLPILPGTDGALACAMAHVILAEGLWNRSYVGDFVASGTSFVPGARIEPDAFEEKGTQGIAAWWNVVLKDATPEWAAPLCGIGSAAIRSAARRFAAAGPRAVSWVSPGVAMCARGLYAGMACYALNGLVGSVGSAGGVLRFPRVSLSKLPDTSAFQDEAARAANARPVVDGRATGRVLAACDGRPFANQLTNDVADAILSGCPYELDTLIAYWVNWAYSCSGAQRWEEALSKVPFFVHVTTNLSETSMFADIVLPVRHHLFEDWGFVRSRQGGVTSVVLEQPCAGAPGECRGDESDFPYDLSVKLAERGFAAPLRYYESLTDPCTGGLVGSGRDLAETAVKIMLQPLWDPEPECGVPSRAKQEAWESFRMRGVWNSERARGCEEGDALAPLPTPTGRFEFESGLLRGLLDAYCQKRGVSASRALELLGYEGRAEAALLPHFEAPVRLGDASAFPFVFMQHRSRLSFEGRSANTRRFQELKGTDPGDEPWDDVLKINPEDMEKLGLESGDEIVVESVQGAVRCRAKSWDGTRPGVVVKCYGQGHWAYGRVAALDFDRGVARGGNNNELLAAVCEGASGATARHGGLMRVAVRRAEPL